MDDLREHRLRVAAARADFLEYGEAGAVGVTDVVAASWQRSQSAGVDADLYHVDYDGNFETDSRLMRCARPVIARLADDMADVPVAIALCDSRARVVDRRDCSAAVGRLLDRVDFQPGFSFQEGGVGTNGVGTVLESGTSVSVVGAEHFNQALIQFACTGAPILDPITGRVEGVLDVSLLADSWTPLIHALVRSAATDIGRSLLLDRGHKQRALFEMYLKADSRSNQAVMAVGSSFMVNRRTQLITTPEEQKAIHQHALFLTMRNDRVSERMILDSGRPIHLRAARVLCGDEVAGILILLQEETLENSHHAPQDARSVLAGEGHRSRELALPEISEQPSARGVPGRCLAWRSACSAVFDALRSQERVLIVGEEGTGKFRAAVEQFERIHPHQPYLRVPAETVVASQDIERAASDGHQLIILCNIDRLTTDGADAVGHFLAAVGREGQVGIVATLSDAALQTDLPFHHVLDHFDVSVTLPPLRHRTMDLDQLVADLLREIAPNRRTRVSPKASRLLAAYSWPGNLTQLREAIQTALLKRPVGEIQADDLPNFCRSASTRILTKLETAERDAIVQALTESDGNRRQAAISLGMSRSSLYRKLKHYAITDGPLTR